MGAMQRAIKLRAKGIHKARERRQYRRNVRAVSGQAERKELKAREQRKDEYKAGTRPLCGGYEHEHIRERYGFYEKPVERGLIARVMHALFGGRAA